MTSFNLKRQLGAALIRTDRNQKYLAYDSNTAQSTVSDHVLGKQPVTADKAVDYAHSLEDTVFNLEIANLFLGTIHAMTGTKYQKNPLALDILQLKETKERLAKKEQVLDILVLTIEDLSPSDNEVILEYADEFLDEILIETHLLVALLELAGSTLPKAVLKRKKYWEKLGYVRKESLYGL